VAVGEGPDLERHRSLARELGLADVVDFEAPRPDALEVIARADLLVVASDFEGQPLVVSEALALGRPVVATAVGRVPELVGPAVGRVVPPDDPAALGAGLAELVLDHDLRRTMGAAAHDAGLSWRLPDVVDAHLSLYAEVGAECRGRRGAKA
jgi:glycosyltransferase involved in cell wall biosynthesis